MKRIVLLEDDEAIRDVFQLALADTYDIVELADGTRILDNEIDAADLFILDRHVSGTDGLDVCRHIKNSEKYKGIPVIMLSANTEIVRLADEVGADAAISKPFSLPMLRETLRNIFNGDNTMQR